MKKEFPTSKFFLTDFAGLHKAAFTLAEVLVTLGIIGVVAAMTMPTLIQNYEKNLTVNRLKHFSSTMQQAYRMRQKDIIEGSFQEMDTTEVRRFNPDDMEKFYNIYWKPYVKTLSTKKQTKGILVRFANGTAAYLQRNYVCPSPAEVTCNLFMVFCPKYKNCETIDSPLGDYTTALDSRNAFAMWASIGRVPQEYKSSNYTRDELLEKCKTQKYYCGSLIEYDGWEIKDDYPW